MISKRLATKLWPRSVAGQQQPAPSRRLPTPTQQQPAPSHNLADAGGYTLQTIIVSAVLVLVAVTASIVLYTAISNNADVRAFADLTSENSPTRPSGFTIAYDIDRGDDPDNPLDPVPTATIGWSPPLYTGQPVLAGSPSLLNYEVSYTCAKMDAMDDDGNPIGLEQVALPETPRRDDVAIPEFNLGRTQVLAVLDSDFETDDNLLVGNCLISVRAYTCPDASPEDPCGINDTKDGSEIYGPASEHRFVISKLPLSLDLDSIQVEVLDDGGLLIVWENPTYLGTQDPEKLIYKVEPNVRPRDEDPPSSDEQPFGTTSLCFSGNSAELDAPPTDMVLDVKVTPQFITDPDQELSGTDCPSIDQVIDVPDLAFELFSLEASSAELPPETPTGLTFALANAEPQSYDAAPLVARSVTEELISWNITWTDPDANADSYLFQWARADGLGQPESQQVSNPEITLALLNGVAYDFSVTAQNAEGVSDPLQACTVVATAHRHLTPNLVVTPRSSELQIKIAPFEQEKYCQSETFCLNNSCQPPPPAQYKIRVYETAISCDLTRSFPDQLCTNSDMIYCAEAPTGDALITERIIANLSADTEYTVEAIAGSRCDAANGTINNTHDGNQPPGILFASLPVTATATVTASSADVFPEVADLTVTVGDDGRSWNIDWSIQPPQPDQPVPEAFLIEFERTTADSMPSIPISFVLRGNIDDSPWDHDGDPDTEELTFACSQQGNMDWRCTIRDDQNQDVATTLNVTITVIYPDGFSDGVTDGGMRSATPPTTP